MTTTEDTAILLADAVVGRLTEGETAWARTSLSRGVIHNALLLHAPERTVVTGPFRPFPRSHAGGPYLGSSRPPCTAERVPTIKQERKHARQRLWRKTEICPP
jgi:hypothetical protein